MKTADAVVVGGGIMGLSCAYQLAQMGISRVVLCEKSALGAGESGKSGAIIRQHYSTSLLVRMARAGIMAYRDFETLTGHSCGWRNVGCLIIAGPNDRAACEQNVRTMKAEGADATLLWGDALREKVPGAVFTDEVGAFESEAGIVDPALAIFALREACLGAGVEILTSCEVTEIEADGKGVRTVFTNAGGIETRNVVLCAGPWSSRLAARTGVDLPLHVVRPQIGFVRRMEVAGSPDHPVIADLVHGFYFRPEDGGRSLMGKLATDDDDVITDPDTYDRSASSEFLEWVQATVSSRLPVIGQGYSRGGYGALYTMTPDSNPILGESPGVRGLYLAVGFSGHGFKLAPAVGTGIAELVVMGRYDAIDMSALRATRFLENEPVVRSYSYGVLS